MMMSSPVPRPRPRPQHQLHTNSTNSSTNSSIAEAELKRKTWAGDWLDLLTATALPPAPLLPMGKSLASPASMALLSPAPSPSASHASTASPLPAHSHSHSSSYGSLLTNIAGSSFLMPAPMAEPNAAAASALQPGSDYMADSDTILPSAASAAASVAASAGSSLHRKPSMHSSSLAIHLPRPLSPAGPAAATSPAASASPGTKQAPLASHHPQSHSQHAHAAVQPYPSRKPTLNNHHNHHNHHHPHQQQQQQQQHQNLQNLSIAERELASHQLLPAFTAKYSLGHELGHGATGFVVAGECLDDGEPVAIKFLYKNRIPLANWRRDRALGIVPLEVFILKRIEHPNIVRFYDVFEDSKFFYLAMEMHGARWKESHMVPDLEPTSYVETPLRPSAASGASSTTTPSAPPRLSLTTPVTVGSVSRPSSIHAPSPSIAIPQPASGHSSAHSHSHATSSAQSCTIISVSTSNSVATLGSVSSATVAAAAAATERLHTRHASLDLFEFIERNPFFAERKIRHIFMQISDSVNYLHQNNIVHQDIKDENIVIDNSLNAKLIDFGAANYIPSSSCDYFEGFRGTIHYMPPEVLRNEKYRGPEVDVWCMGVLLYTMAFSCLPFRTPEDIATASYRHPRFKRSAILMDLINSMLKVSPADRPTMAQVVMHPWLVSGPPLDM
ncbi:kinase-like domain-containing protein [Entophlyctis helioformis]|nr:kinase-like domain-containing protein [Entophlyctis helioformis]